VTELIAAPHGLVKRKLAALVQGARLVRKELGG
jgi:hypothetical protein